MSYYYCAHCQTLPGDNIHRIHHDTVYGLGIDDDNELFGRLILEINQAGLSWDTILKKEDHFRRAYSQFDVKSVAHYGEDDRARLMGDAGIIRNRLKINAAIVNAQRILDMQQEFGSFYHWIRVQHAENIKDWVRIFKKEFKFVGGEIVNEFLMSIGRIDGSHHPDCIRRKEYEQHRVLWDKS